MRSSSLFLVAASSLTSSAVARLHSLPEDTHAFPKFAVSFLSGQPVLKETADRWLRDGLQGGQDEFLDRPWQPHAHHDPTQRKEIGMGDTSSDTQAPVHDFSSFSAVNYTLEHMRMGPTDSYLCLIPRPSETASSRDQDDAESDPTPAKSWSLLQPLSGTCLYHRQGWFTYSYCHNKEIRQFKELAQPQSRLPAGTYRPMEDPDWEAYSLGVAPPSDEPGADLTVAERNAQAANLELARNAGSRYLVQRWGGGTQCDKTGKPREVEVQFHCSMVMTDHILFVKETKTCSYVLVIHTPRLCGEPGFKSRRDAGNDSIIQCREIVDSFAPDARSPWPPLPARDTPWKVPRRKTVLPLPVKQDKAKPKSTTDTSSDSASDAGQKEYLTGIVEKAVEFIMESEGGLPRVGAITGSKPKRVNAYIQDGELVLKYIDEEGSDDDGNTGAQAAGNTKSSQQGDKDSSGSSSSNKGRNSKDTKSRKPAPKRRFGERFEL